MVVQDARRRNGVPKGRAAYMATCTSLGVRLPGFELLTLVDHYLGRTESPALGTK